MEQADGGQAAQANAVMALCLPACRTDKANKLHSQATGLHCGLNSWLTTQVRTLQSLQTLYPGKELRQAVKGLRQRASRSA